MLEFLMGADPEAKREYIAKRLYDTIVGGKKAVLIVPEQEDFDRNREMMELWGEKISNSITVTSFSRFSRQLLEELGEPLKAQADDAAISVLMSLAVRQVSGELKIYSSHGSRPGRVAALVSLFNEMENAGKSPEELEAAGRAAGGRLKEKTQELALIFTVFKGLLSERFSSSADNINSAAEKLGKTSSFSETDFYFDDFRGFTGTQIKFISALLPNCRNCFVSIVGFSGSSEKISFEHALKNRRKLIAEAEKNSISVCQREIPRGEKSSGLMALGEGLFLDGAEPLKQPTDDVVLVKAPNKYDECEFIALTSKKLLDEGFCRARDMAVLHRSPEMAAPLISALEKYGVPVFRDERRKLLSYPLARLLLSAVETAAKGFSTERILSLVKTGIAGVSLMEYSELENYVYRWQIDGREWESSFFRNPRGFGNEDNEETKEKLAFINQTRKTICDPLKKLSDALKDENPEKSCIAVYFYLKEIKAAENFKEYAVSLYQKGEESEAIQCARVWDECMENLGALKEALGSSAVSPAYFYELLSLIFSGNSVGNIPPGIDKMTVGSVDRTKLLAPKVVFIPGFCENTFPKSSVSDGLLSSKELRLLAEGDMALDKLPEEVYEEERLILYNTLTLAGKRLYISYPEAATTGEKNEPSAIIADIKKLMPDLSEINAADISPEEKIKTPASAFSQLALMYKENSELRMAIGDALKEEKGEAGIAALSRAAAGNDENFSDPSQALRLFGEDIAMSASKAETYSKCPFMYFCRYGMGVEKLTRSRIDARINGLIIHRALEVFMSEHMGEELNSMTDAEIKRIVNEAVDDYCEKNLGGVSGLSLSMARTVKRLKEEIFHIIAVRKEEFSTCLFKTAATELNIGRSGGINAYEIPLPDGGKIVISGSVDRVDIMNDGERAYVRVIDYKTGGKDFDLSDIFYGINMQMLIYLFAVCDNGVKLFGELTPAGVLYVPAKSSGKALERSASSDDVLSKRLENGRMNGIILQNAEVIKGMEATARGVFINAKIEADGTLKGKLVSLDEFSLLHKKIDEVLSEMGMNIHSGIINAFPIDKPGDHSICDYCDYSSVCLKEKSCEKRTILKTSHEDALKRLWKEESGK
ncbi:MAG: PD-(D/E)XK nuclease family protein [Oscillospiraceae bacterium]|nr:PD-(D/E)XK nuclease family protein [Oscillospiraceae bacterium]